jgi:2-C-methyl-D-erythritol 2,4-cyclodiphosphate synthase
VISQNFGCFQNSNIATPPYLYESLDGRLANVNVGRRAARGNGRVEMRFRVGQGFDFHPLETGRKLMLGGVEIEYPAGLRGHSDADVAAHALANAILGALGEGDLGLHFPDSDPRYLGADSIRLLESVWKWATDLGWKLVNADITIMAAWPKLAPHLPAMRARLAAALAVDKGLLNVKASNPEGLGALGRGEGMASAAIVMLQAD